MIAAHPQGMSIHDSIARTRVVRFPPGVTEIEIDDEPMPQRPRTQPGY
jgi:hypothetical protein